MIIHCILALYILYFGNMYNYYMPVKNLKRITEYTNYIYNDIVFELKKQF